MRDYITNRQMSFIIFGIVLGYGVINIPKDIAENAGTGGWVPILIGTVIAIIFTYIITYLGYVYKNKTIYEYCPLLTGKTIALIIISIYSVYYFLLFTMIMRVASETIKLTILLKTPVWVIILAFLIVVYYSVINNFRTIARICEIYGIIIIIIALIIHISMFTQGKLINMKPFFVVEDIPAYLKSTVVTIFPFIGVEILMIIPFNKKENNRNIFKYTVFMMALIGMLYIVVVESCISVIGVEGIVQYKASLYAAIRRVDIEKFEMFRRLDSIFIIGWIMVIFCSLTLTSYGCVFLTSKLLKKSQSKLLIFIVFVISYIVAQIPDTMTQIEKVIDYTGYLSLFTMFLVPLILLIITKVKKYDKKII